MKRLLPNLFVAVILLLTPSVNFGQAPALGTTSSFALFTATGAFNVAGATTIVTGDVGTNVGAFNGFPPGTLIGQRHVTDPTSVTAATDVALAYGSLSTVTCGQVISVTLGNGQTLLPDVYCTGAATTINGDLILDGQGDPNSIFIFKFGGALATTVNSRIILRNGASICNVYWQVNGQVDLGENSIFQGTILANGPIHLLDGATLYGQGLSQAGAISLQNNIVTLGERPTASVITASGATSICAGGSVILSGNIGGTWNTGATTPTITVTTSGDYYVTNTSNCGSIISNHIEVTVNPLPVCSITGNNSICTGGSTELCTTLETGSTYLWSTGATTNCITVNAAGTYTVTVTSSAGCISVCSKTVTVGPAPDCTITGNNVICLGGSTQLCTPMVTGATYLWSTGATTNCITVNSAGTYSVTVTYPGGCSSVCSKTVTVGPAPDCTITGNNVICLGGSTQLCTPMVTGGTYLWSTGATTNCITVNSAGTYSVTVTYPGGCSSVCSKTVTVGPAPNCTITGNDVLCLGGSTQLCTPMVTGATYLWSTGATTNCITVNSAGTYSVTVTYPGGCSSVCSKTVTVGPAPDCTITGSSTICVDGSTQLCVPLVKGNKYLWTKETTKNGITETKCIIGDTLNCITVDAKSAGTYTVTVTNVSGCVSVCTKTVTVSPAPDCTITGNSYICAGGSTQLCTPMIKGSTYLWSTGATTNCITVKAAGTYSVTVTNSAGCSSVCSKTVTVGPAPNCTITGNDVLCLGGSTQLCTPMVTGGTYLWSTGATTNCITVTEAGTYSVTVTYPGGCTSVCSKTVTVGPAPDCTITGSSSICVDGSTQLCVPLVKGNKYLWTKGITKSGIPEVVTNCIIGDTLNCITVDANSAGTYTVTVTNASGCVSVCTKTVTVSPAPDCTITGNSSICVGGSTQLCTPMIKGNTYLWSTGATTNCITVKAAGTYTVTVTNSAGCSSVCSKTVTVSTAPDCTITGNSSVCDGESSQLCTPLVKGSTYLWSTGETTNCITVKVAGTYTVTVTNSSGCTSVCSKSVTYDSKTAGMENAVETLSLVDAKAYPNPFNTIATIEFNVNVIDSRIIVELYTLAGTKVATLFDKNVIQGVPYKVEINGDDLPEGIYIYRILNGHKTFTSRLVLMK